MLNSEPIPGAGPEDAAAERIVGAGAIGALALAGLVFFSWTLHAIVYSGLYRPTSPYYTIIPRAIGGRLYSDMMGRLAFVLFLLVAMPIGIHHLFADPQVGAGFKFLHSVFTALVALPTLLTVFTICGRRALSRRHRAAWARSTKSLYWPRRLSLKRRPFHLCRDDRDIAPLTVLFSARDKAHYQTLQKRKNNDHAEPARGYAAPRSACRDAERCG